MFEKYNSSGYDLYQPFEGVDQWVIDPKDSNACHGTLREVVKFMVDKLYFRVEDIDFALNFLLDSVESGSVDHNAIHFGMYKSAIYTFNHEGKYGQQAS